MTDSCTESQEEPVGVMCLAPMRENEQWTVGHANCGGAYETAPLKKRIISDYVDYASFELFELRRKKEPFCTDLGKAVVLPYSGQCHLFLASA